MGKRYGLEDNGFQTLVKAILWGLFVFILFLVFLTILQCSVKKPSAPTWNTRLNIPLINKTYDMRTIVEKLDDLSLILDSLGNPCFYKKIEVDTIRMDKILTLDSTDQSFFETLGVFRITPPDTQKTEFLLKEVYSGELGLLPSFSFLLEEKLQRIETFSSVTLDKGEAFIKVSNHLGLDLDSLSIDLIDKITSEIIGTVIYSDGISNDSSKVGKIDLAKKSFSNDLSFDIKAHTPGGTILTLADKYLLLSLFFSDSIYVKEAKAQIPEIFKEIRNSFFLPKDHTIEKGEIEKGKILFKIYNKTNLSADMEITLPNLTKAENPLSLTEYLPPLSLDEMEIILDDCKIQSVSNGEIALFWSLKTSGTGEEQVEVKSSDSIKIFVEFKKIEFRKLSGVFSPTQIKIEREPEPLDIPTGFETAKLSGAYLKAEILNGVNLPAVLSLKLMGDQGKQLEILEDISSGTSSNPMKTLIVKDDLTDFFNPIPYMITVSGEALYGDGMENGTVTREDFVWGKLEIFSQIEVIFDSNQLELDSDSLSLEEEDRKLLSQRANWTNVVILLENHLPLDLSLELFINDSEDVYNQPDLVVGPVKLNSGEKDQNGIVINPASSETKIELKKEDLKIFEKTPFWIGGYINLFGTNGEKIKIVAKDYLKITSFVEAEIQLGEIK